VILCNAQHGVVEGLRCSRINSGKCEPIREVTLIRSGRDQAESRDGCCVFRHRVACAGRSALIAAGRNAGRVASGVDYVGDCGEGRNGDYCGFAGSARRAIEGPGICRLRISRDILSHFASPSMLGRPAASNRVELDGCQVVRRVGSP